MFVYVPDTWCRASLCRRRVHVEAYSRTVNNDIHGKRHSMARRRHGKRAAPQFVLILRAKSGIVPDTLGCGSLTCQSYVSFPVSGQKVLRKTKRHRGLLRGTPGDNLRPTPAGVIGSTSGGPSKSLLKEHNGRGNVSLIRLSFDEVEDRTRVRAIVTGKEVEDADLKMPFKEAVKTP
ncbi:hypothetical protein Tco_0048863 [Tanacetum coccineum]